MGLRHAFGNRLLPAFLAFGGLVAAAGGAGFRQALRYDRTALAAGEVHRLATGHFAHLGWPHFALNAAGLGLIWLLVGNAYSILEWLFVVVLCMATIDAGFWILLPTLEWYVGLSGLLHGLLAAGALGNLRRRRAESVAILVVLAVKLAYEALAGPLPGSVGVSGGPIVTQAHLYGAAGGVAAAALISIGNRWRAPI